MRANVKRVSTMNKRTKAVVVFTEAEFHKLMAEKAALKEALAAADKLNGEYINKMVELEATIASLRVHMVALRKAAKEIRQENINGWGNACEQAADAIRLCLN